MSIFADVDYASLNKYNEELCGDKVEVIRKDDSVIVVLADGLGSGVKANTLATLTSRIISKMLSMGIAINEAVETVMNTLPVCEVRGIPYSTFSILQIFESGECYLIEFNNPEALRLKWGKFASLPKTIREINGKFVKESRFTVSPNDIIVLVSDGAVHAGVGTTLNMGWQWENVKNYLENIYRKNISSKTVTNLLLSACDGLYGNKPGDDTTVVCVKIKNCLQVNVLLGPPADKALDSFVVNRFMSEKGKKVVCGGTTATIVARETGKSIGTNFNYFDGSIPPAAYIEGIDLTLEGVHTISKTLDYIKKYLTSKNTIDDFIDLNGKDGAAKLAKLFIEESTKVHFIVGRAVNPAHQNSDFPYDLQMKLKLVEEMEKYLKMLGKKVEVEYY